jgi:hypothetical protein
MAFLPCPSGQDLWKFRIAAPVRDVLRELAASFDWSQVVGRLRMTKVNL